MRTPRHASFRTRVATYAAPADAVELLMRAYHGLVYDSRLLGELAAEIFYLPCAVRRRFNRDAKRRGGAIYQAQTGLSGTREVLALLAKAASHSAK